MHSITLLGGVQGLAAYLATTRGKAPAAAVAAENTASTGERVSLSAAARAAQQSEAAAKSTGIALPQSIRDWFDKTFSDDVLAEAQSRLADIRASGALGAEGPLALPLLPESQALLDGFRAEMRDLSANGHAAMDESASARFSQLLNLSIRVQMQGWSKPMASEADAQREFDIANAMAVLVRDNPELAPPADAATSQSWTDRWQAAGLTMPVSEPRPGASFWLQMAENAGFDEAEFMAAARELAGRYDGHALTRQVEQLIANRYTQTREAAG